MERPPELPEDIFNAFVACRPAFVDSYMAGIGFAKQESTAKKEQVPPAIRMEIENRKYWGRFGLSGGFGIGKTFAVVTRLRRQAEQAVDQWMVRAIQQAIAPDPYSGQIHFRLLEALTRDKQYPNTPWPLWCNWPGESAANRAKLYRKCQDEVEDWILRLEDPNRLVILDDIGADSRTTQDWSGETLGRIIDARLRSEADTIWTSNLNAKGLAERYGARTFSRLQALAPIIELPKMPDLRLQGMGKAS